MPDLRFTASGDFTIVQFTDTHIKNGEVEDCQTQSLMERVLEVERPQLVVLTGDVIEGEPCRDPAWAWRFAVEPMERRGIPWAAAFGNHDDEGSLSRPELLEVQQSCSMCLTQRGPEDISGVGNYWLPIRPAVGSEIITALFFLDSGSYTTLKRYDYIKPDQIRWFVQTSRQASHQNGGRPIPSLVFFHIPLPEYDDVWDQGLARGTKLEKVCRPAHNSGFLDAMAAAGGVMGVFVGHDHINDYEGTLRDIRLCYGRGTGYATYGREGFRRGARVIRLRENTGGLETWCRLDDGSVVRYVS